MKTRSALITILSVLLVASPAFSRPGPFEKLPDGSIRHTFSGFVFPKTIGVFRREPTHQYNPAGSDVSVGYNTGVLVAATVYVYPAPSEQSVEILSREYASKRAEVLHGHQGVTVLSETSVTINQAGGKFTGRRAYFTYHDILALLPQEVKSQLLVFHDGPVFIEYRFSYPFGRAEEAEQKIEEFIRAWSWRGSL
jgi:hypothetical protein